MSGPPSAWGLQNETREKEGMGRRAWGAITALIAIALVVAFTLRDDRNVQGAGGEAGASPRGDFTSGAAVASHDIGPTGAQIDGVVLAPDGKPLDGAVVALEIVEDSGPRNLEATRTSASGGAFNFGPLPRGRYRLTATARGFRASSGPVLELDERASRHTELRLGTGGVTVTGHVHDSGGGPIAGATVTAADESLFSTTTDPQGAYAITLDPSAYRFTADAHGYAKHGQFSSLRVDKTIDFLLHPGARLRGRVLARDTSEPVAGAELSLLDSEGLVESGSRSETSSS